MGSWDLSSHFKLVVRFRESEASKNQNLFCPTFSYFFCSDLSNHCFSLLFGILGVIMDKI